MTGNKTQYISQPTGDSGIMLRFGDVITGETQSRVLAMDRAITRAGLPGVRELVPSFTGILVIFDPLKTDAQTLETSISALNPDEGATDAPKNWVIPCCYEGNFAPDLAEVAAKCGISEEAAINAHTGAEFRLGMYGFAPGYGYLSGTPDSIQLPRKTAPVRDIPAGAVMIAGPQCIVTTMVMPTGWWIIGRTMFEFFRPDDDNPFPLSVGDTIHFSRRTYDDFMREPGS